ncbi:hypothetical protein ABZ552_24325 [Nocardia sp. NPDC019219]|uniref:hypothetical protein n=1 Tax=Nocardia sp. NPDC019219 TaxID=3154590 RepID=UPI0033D170C4
MFRQVVQPDRSRVRQQQSEYALPRGRAADVGMRRVVDALEEELDRPLVVSADA